MAPFELSNASADYCKRFRSRVVAALTECRSCTFTVSVVLELDSRLSSGRLNAGATAPGSVLIAAGAGANAILVRFAHGLGFGAFLDFFPWRFTENAHNSSSSPRDSTRKSPDSCS